MDLSRLTRDLDAIGVFVGSGFDWVVDIRTLDVVGATSGASEAIWLSIRAASMWANTTSLARIVPSAGREVASGW
jgi:hypothetical protein